VTECDEWDEDDENHRVIEKSEKIFLLKKF